MKLTNVNIFFFILLCTTALMACEKSLDYQVTNQESVKVLYAFPMPDSTISVHASKSTNIIGSSLFEYLNGAQLYAYTNNQLRYAASYPNNTEWFNIPSLKAEHSVKYDFVIIDANGDSLTASTIIPEAIVIDTIISSKSQTVGMLDNNANSYKFTVHFSDPEQIKNYYQLRVDAVINSNNEQITTTINYPKDDPVFLYSENENDLLTGIDYGGTFSDQLINGADYKLVVTITNSILDLEEGATINKMHFHLYSLSKEYYTYIRSSIAEEAYQNSIFYESHNVYSNVNGGIGAVGGLSVSKYNIEFNK